MKKFLIYGLAGLILSLGVGCSKSEPNARGSQSKMDQPQYHNLIGERKLQEGDYNGAKKSFQKAVDLDRNNSPALAGLAVARAHQTNRPEVSRKTKKRIFAEGLDLIEKAVDKAKNDQEKAHAYLAGVRFHVVMEMPQGGWYKATRKYFKKAVQLAPENPATYFYMASAEATQLNYAKAKSLYAKVMKLYRDFADEADQEMKRIQKIERSLPSSKFGAQVANVGQLTRADAAALLLAELRLDRLYVGQQKQYSSAFAPPETQRAFQRSPAQTLPPATDLRGNPLADSINLLLKLGLKGLEADAQHRFHPSEPLTRAEFALVLQDILVKLTGDEGISTRFLGQASPHPDVPGDRWYYNAVRTVVNRGMMEVKSARTGAFDPMGEVSGADALLAIKKLKALAKRY